MNRSLLRRVLLPCLVAFALGSSPAHAQAPEPSRSAEPAPAIDAEALFRAVVRVDVGASARGPASSSGPPASSSRSAI
jgi:hypothetical protein